jgi:hypothetical protein
MQEGIVDVNTNASNSRAFSFFFGIFLFIE